jgi:hypothetical protein
MLVLPPTAVQTGAFHPNGLQLRLTRDSLQYGMAPAMILGVSPLAGQNSKIEIMFG